VFVSEKPCVDCDFLGMCGGRCYYTNVTKRWPDNEYAAVCGTVKALVASVNREIPRIHKLIECGRLKIEDFDYLKFNGCEIVP